MSSIHADFPRSQLLAEKLYRQRWWWIMSFGITLLWSVFYYATLLFVEYTFGSETYEFQQTIDFFQYGMADGYIQLGLLVAIPFVLLTSALFEKIQKVVFPEKKPLAFLLFRPAAMLELLDAISKYDRVVKSENEKRFWNSAFAVLQPVNLFVLIFPVYLKLASAGLTNEWINSIFFLLQFAASLTWIVVLNRIFVIIKPEIIQHDSIQAEAPQEPTAEELGLVRKQIDKLRSNGLSSLVYQILALLAVVFSTRGYLDWNTLLDQLTLFENSHLLIKIGFFATLALTLFLLYYLWVIVRIANLLERPDSWLGWIVIITYFIPVLSTVTRFYAIHSSATRWNSAMQTGQFNFRLLLSKEISVWWAVVFSLFTLYNTGCFRDFFVESIDFESYLLWREKVYGFMYPISYILLHAFMLLLIVYSKELEQKCEAAADELEQSYFPQQPYAGGKHAIEPPHADATAE